MARMKKYTEYKDKYLTLPRRTRVSGRVRVFLWTLVQKIQKDHIQNVCRSSISKFTIHVKSRVAYLTGKKLKFTADLALRNYRQLAFFLKHDVFDGVSPLPYSISNFISLLRGNPLSHQYLLARHYGILPRRLQLHVISAFARRTRTIPSAERANVESIIDSVHGEENWNKHIKPAEESEVRPHERYLMKKFNDQEYETLCPGLRTHGLLGYCRNVVAHADELPDLRVRLIVLTLDLWFPSVYTDVMLKLSDNQKLFRFNINPGDPTVDSLD